MDESRQEQQQGDRGQQQRHINNPMSAVRLDGWLWAAGAAGRKKHTSWLRTSMAALGVCGIAAGGGLLAAPAASAANPMPLPRAVTERIARDRLDVQVSNGWEAVTGPASRVNDARNLATSLGVGNVVAYTGNGKSGRAVLIFTGHHDAPVGFQVTGGTVVRSVANDTDQKWYAYDDQGRRDAVVAPETARNIPPADFFVFNRPPSTTTSTTNSHNKTNSHNTTTTTTTINFNGPVNQVQLGG